MLFLAATVSIAFFLTALFRRGQPTNQLISMVASSVLFTILSSLVWLHQAEQKELLADVEREVVRAVDQLVLAFPRHPYWSAPPERAEFQTRLVWDIPASLGTLSVFLIALQILVFARIYRKEIFETFSVQEEWVWVVIVFASGAYLLSPPWQSISMVGFRISLAPYFLHGFAIALFSVRRLFASTWSRAFLLISFLLFALPLLLGIGFFDLWFDFRGRLKVKQEPNSQS